MTLEQSEISARLESALEAGELSSAVLREGLSALLQRSARRQALLYIQTPTTAPSSPAVGMTLVQNGKMIAPPTDADSWPYQNVLDAINDGWRVVSFPNMALLALSADDPHGLGFEFILEKWS